MFLILGKNTSRQGQQYHVAYCPSPHCWRRTNNTTTTPVNMTEFRGRLYLDRSSLREGHSGRGQGWIWRLWTKERQGWRWLRGELSWPRGGTRRTTTSSMVVIVIVKVCLTEVMLTVITKWFQLSTKAWCTSHLVEGAEDIPLRGMVWRSATSVRKGSVSTVQCTEPRERRQGYC